MMDDKKISPLRITLIGERIYGQSVRGVIAVNRSADGAPYLRKERRGFATDLYINSFSSCAFGTGKTHLLTFEGQERGSEALDFAPRRPWRPLWCPN
ncbi:hypothetical protein JTE90_027712 [Oedothorax gibbosus]|uniref:Uncharacterized protein n=1 Tax=Oedothorax gibbosus TaxID=931172 RepID=A0AAV6UVS0_9ARAC|nr:hypothetical protein JTE90_027712 [Oedothorax gibbosus]